MKNDTARLRIYDQGGMEGIDWCWVVLGKGKWMLIDS